MSMRDDAVANAKVSQAMPRKIRERPALQITKKDGQEDDDQTMMMTSNMMHLPGGRRAVENREKGW